MKIYIAGKITGLDNYREKFGQAAKMLEDQGHNVMNPAILPEGFRHEEYMKICFSMIDVCQAVYFLDNWKDSIGARLEYEYALYKDKQMIFKGEKVDSRKEGGDVSVKEGCKYKAGARREAEHAKKEMDNLFGRLKKEGAIGNGYRSSYKAKK